MAGFVARPHRLRVGPHAVVCNRRRRFYQNPDSGQLHRLCWIPATVATESDTLIGGTVGGGLEYAFNTNWSAGIEGRYTWYGNHTFNSGALATFGFPPGGPFTFAATTQTLRFDTAEVVAKLNYRFNTLVPDAPDRGRAKSVSIDVEEPGV